MMTMHTYSSDFYEFLAHSSGKSARKFMEIISPSLNARSVLDVGCGQGAWLAAWLSHGATEVTGLDGAYVDKNALEISADDFHATDLSKSFNLNRRYDLVQCLEVAEHIQASCAETLVASLARHGDIILFSAATPGQGGEHHVNEQPLEYWAAHFARLGFRAFDFVRPKIRNVNDIEPWYRYNTIIYANSTGVKNLKPEIIDCEIPPDTGFPRTASWKWIVRCKTTRMIPFSVINLIARLKHAWIIRKRPCRH